MNSQTISLIMIEWPFDFHPPTDYKFGCNCPLTFPNPCQAHGIFCCSFIVLFINQNFFNCLIGIQTTTLHFLHQTGNYFFNLLELFVMKCNLFHLSFLKAFTISVLFYNLSHPIKIHVVYPESKKCTPSIQHRALVSGTRLKNSG